MTEIKILTPERDNEFSPKLVQPGTYGARCYSIILMGTFEEIINNEVKKLKKIRFSWELPTEMAVFDETKGPQPFVVHAEYNFTYFSDKSKLWNMVSSWLGEKFTREKANEFDFASLLGKPCSIAVSNNINKSGRAYNSVLSVAPLMKGIVLGKQINPSLLFSIDAFDPNVFETLPQWLKDRIASSEEYKKLNYGN